MRRFLFGFSLGLKNSKKYQNKKKFVRDLLENRETSHTKNFDFFMIILILFSLWILVFNKAYIMPNWIILFDIYIISSIFFLEYIIRFWIFNDTHKLILGHYKKKTPTATIIVDIFKKKLHYIFSLTGIIDFLAIFPQFRIVRLLKLYHYLYGTKTLLTALSKKEFEFKFLGYTLVSVVFSFASVLYIVEYDANENIHTFLDALYWALVTISTVGYGDISPVTDMGKMISMVGIILGIMMISFMTSVMVSAFAERFDELRTHSSINRLQDMHNVVIINGYGYLGSRIAHYINEEGKYNCVIIEESKEKINRADSSSQVVIYGDGCSQELMEQIYERNNIIVMLTLKNSDIENIYFILNAKSYKSDALIFSRITHPHLLSQYKSIKTDLIVDPYAIIHKRAFAYSKNYLNNSNCRCKRVILFGYSLKSKSLADKFKDAQIDIKIYDTSKEEIGSAKELGFRDVELINFEDEKHMETLKLLKNDLIICSMHDEAINHYLAISLKVNKFNGKIVALSDTKQNNRQLKLAGADVIFDLYDESAKEFIGNIDNI